MLFLVFVCGCCTAVLTPAWNSSVVDPVPREEWTQAISQMKAPRRRDGATFWRIYKDLAEPSRDVERFIVTSWADYLHQRARATVADHTLEAEVRAFLAPDESAHMSHYIAER